MESVQKKREERKKTTTRFWLAISGCLWPQPAPHCAIIRRSFLQSRRDCDSLNSITSSDPLSFAWFKGALRFLFSHPAPPSRSSSKLPRNFSLSGFCPVVVVVVVVAAAAVGSPFIQWVRVWRCCSSLCAEFSSAKVSYLPVTNRSQRLDDDFFFFFFFYWIKSSHVNVRGLWYWCVCVCVCVWMLHCEITFYYMHGHRARPGEVMNLSSD